MIQTKLCVGGDVTHASLPKFWLYSIRYHYDLVLKGTEVLQKEIAVEIMHTSHLIILCNLNELSTPLMEWIIKIFPTFSRRLVSLPRAIGSVVFFFFLEKKIYIDCLGFDLCLFSILFTLVVISKICICI